MFDIIDAWYNNEDKFPSSLNALERTLVLQLTVANNTGYLKLLEFLTSKSVARCNPTNVRKGSKWQLVVESLAQDREGFSKVLKSVSLLQFPQTCVNSGCW